jgi:hypothetical protein
MRNTALRLSLLPLAACLALACSDEVIDDVVVGPTGQPTLAFDKPAAASAPTCVSIGDDPGYRLPMLLSYSELLLRPPGGCAGALQCGHLALYVQDVLNNEAATPAIDLVFANIGDRYHDGSTHRSSKQPDVLPVVAEVVDENGEALLDHDGEVVAAAIDLITVPDCASLAAE